MIFIDFIACYYITYYLNNMYYPQYQRAALSPKAMIIYSSMLPSGKGIRIRYGGPGYPRNSQRSATRGNALTRWILAGFAVRRCLKHVRPPFTSLI